MPETKTHQRFRSRAEQLEMYLEAMDAAARVTYNMLGHKEHEGKNVDDALPIKCDNYTRLNHRSRVYNYCRSKNTLSAIVEVFGFFSEYMRDVLKEIYITNPMAVVGKSNKQLNLTFVDISKFVTLNELHTKMVDDVFRSIENERSTIKLIDRILKDTGANISSADKEAVLPYLELRHLIIHNNSKIDRAFEDKYGALFSLKAGDKVPSKFNVADTAIEKIIKFIKKVDSEFIRLNLVPAI